MNPHRGDFDPPLSIAARHRGKAVSSLASRCASNFSSKSRDRGRAYAGEGRAQVESFSEHKFVGSVRGSGRHTYSVSLDVPDDHDPGYAESLFAFCECPHFDRSGAVCKHLWAFILVLDMSGLTEEFPGSGELDLLEPDDPDDIEDDLFDDDSEYEAFGDAMLRFVQRDRIEPRPAWRFLSRAGSAQRAVPTTLHYVAQYSSSSVWTVTLFELVGSSADQVETIRRLSSSDTPGSGWLSCEDRAALTALKGCEETAVTGPYARTSYGYNRGYGWGKEAPSQYTFSDGLAGVVLPLLAATRRLYWCPAMRLPATFETQQLEALRWHGDDPLSLMFRLVRVDDANESPKKKKQASKKKAAGRRQVTESGPWRLTAELHGPDAPAVAELDRVGESGIAIARNRIYRVEPAEHTSLLERLRLDGPLAIDEDAIDDFIAFAAPLELPGLAWPESLEWQVDTPEPTGRISFQGPRSHTPKTMVWATFAFDYHTADGAADDDPNSEPRSKPHTIPHDAAAAVLVERKTKRICKRDFEAEAALRTQVFHAGLSEMSATHRYEADLQIKRNAMSAAVATLLARGWTVEAEGVRYASSSSHKLSVTSGIDWFDLEGSVSFDDVEVPLPELLAALEHDDGVVVLGDGRHGVLPIEWLSKVARIAGFGRAEEGRIRFAPHQAMLLDALLDSRDEVERDDVFSKACKRLGETRKRRRVRAPRGLEATLRPYQKEGLAWLVHMAETGLGCCLADDMGLGKTVQALGLLASRVESRTKEAEALPSIAVVPASLVHNWLAEAEKFTPSLQLLDYTGPKRAELRDQFERTDLIVTTYGVLRRDIQKLIDQRFDVVILDEAQAIKNASTQASKATRLLRAESRVALSGTPVENHLTELWALFDFLNPGLLGGASRGLRSLDQASPEAIELIARGVGPFILRRTKAEVLPDLPPKTEQTLYCDLEGKQKKAYAQLRDHYRSSLLRRVDREGLNKSKIQVLEAILRLRQAACHPALIDPKRASDGSAKLDLLMESLDQTIEEGHKILVFSQFTSLLALVRTSLDAKGVEYEYLDGRTRNRGARVARFQEDADCRVFLISLKAGGHGLNLTAADYAFLLDPWWNPAAEAQAIDRMHRIGQTRPVFAYRLVARDTIEERILELQDRKRELADAVIAGARSHLKELTREDLERLLE